VKILVVYHTLSGNTEKVANTLADRLSKNHEVTLKRLEPVGRYNHFHVFLALAGLKVPIRPLDVEPLGYDAICLGCPVWAGSPTPAVNAFIDGLELKGVVYPFVTCAAPTTGALKKMTSRLERKGLKVGASAFVSFPPKSLPKMEGIEGLAGRVAQE
jgi:flavodoxin